MSELKVQGSPHLVRRSKSPGVLVNTNREGFHATIKSREKAQEFQDLKSEVEILRELVAQKLGGGAV